MVVRVNRITTMSSVCSIVNVQHCSYFQASQGSHQMSNIREKEGDTACYRGEALWLDTEGEVFILCLCFFFST